MCINLLYWFTEYFPISLQIPISIWRSQNFGVGNPQAGIYLSLNLALCAAEVCKVLAYRVLGIFDVCIKPAFFVDDSFRQFLARVFFNCHRLCTNNLDGHQYSKRFFLKKIPEQTSERGISLPPGKLKVRWDRCLCFVIFHVLFIKTWGRKGIVPR